MTRAALLALALVACNGDDPAETDTDPDTEPEACEAVDPPCIDAMILDLSLHDDKVSSGAVTTTTEGADFVTVIDATAGGFGQEVYNPWVYVRFEDSGAVRVDLDDESALESTEWHLAARRFIVRLNGGASGPSCVGAAAFPATTYADLDSVPDTTSFPVDDYYDGDCTIIEDGSQLPGSPRVALDGWWTYAGCVATTGLPFAVRLEDGRVLKLSLEAFYATGQETCNSTDTPGTAGGTLRVRWRFMD